MNDERKLAKNIISVALAMSLGLLRGTVFFQAQFTSHVTIRFQDRAGVKRVINKLRCARNNGLKSELE